MLTARFLSPRVLSEKAFDALIGRMARDFCTDRISCEISWNGLQGAVATDDIIETSQCHLLQKCQRPLPLACQESIEIMCLDFWHDIKLHPNSFVDICSKLSNPVYTPLRSMQKSRHWGIIIISCCDWYVFKSSHFKVKISLIYGLRMQHGMMQSRQHNTLEKSIICRCISMSVVQWEDNYSQHSICLLSHMCSLLHCDLTNDDSFPPDYPKPTCLQFLRWFGNLLLRSFWYHKPTRGNPHTTDPCSPEGTTPTASASSKLNA